MDSVFPNVTYMEKLNCFSTPLGVYFSIFTYYHCISTIWLINSDSSTMLVYKRLRV